MSGIYIHIPFCRKACSYCNFHFSTSIKLADAMVDAMCKEIQIRASKFQSQPLETIYLGGGTPSLLSAESLRKLFQLLQTQFDLSQVKEITLEANPEDVTQENIDLWLSLGIQRISLGIQSLNDEELKFMNRNHSAAQSIQSLELLIQNNIHCISADLIYGSPLKSNQQFKDEIQHLLGMGLQHLSAYALTVEPKTLLFNQVEKNKVPPILDQYAEYHFYILQEQIELAGWDAYEISNYCKPGHRAIHNSNYWKGLPYLGIGPSAHSYFEGQRLWNIANNALYIKGLELGELNFEIETLTVANQINEYIMTGLRTAEGIHPSKITVAFPSWVNEVQPQIESFKQSNWLVQHNDTLQLTTTGKLWSDHIISELMVSDQ